jgi:hypothetical protein
MTPRRDGVKKTRSGLIKTGPLHKINEIFYLLTIFITWVEVLA